MIDDKSDKLVYYGIDELAETDDEGNITSGQYDGKWICLGDEPLTPEIVSSSPSSVEYRAKVLRDGVPVYLMFSYDRASGEFTISGTKPYTSEDAEYEFINMRVSSESIVGSKIVPIYMADDTSSPNEYEIEVKAVKCNEKTKITRKELNNSTYAVLAVITNQRGDICGSDLLFFDITDGEINKLYTSEEFYRKLEEEGKIRKAPQS